MTEEFGHGFGRDKKQEVSSKKTKRQKIKRAKGFTLSRAAVF